MNALKFRQRHGISADDGFTLIELIVAMFVFSIFLAIMITSIVALTRGANRIQVAAVSANQELAVFQRLDRQIRYADGINQQGAGPSGAIYFEFRTPSDSASTHVTTCTQWRYDPVAKTVASRSWPDGNLGAATVWNVQLNNVANDGGANYPFQLNPVVSGGSSLEEFTLTLDAGNTTVKGNLISSTFVARNSTQNTSTGAGGPICPAAGSRQ
jgi:prepilin-type N-terminal cleavage/methylation domain-containing protein